MLSLQIISPAELLRLQETARCFHPDMTPNGSSNYYTRQRLQLSQWGFPHELQTELARRAVVMAPQSLWLNEVSVGKAAEEMHVDASDGTAITFVNDDFEGGALEYEDVGELCRILPQAGHTVILLNKMRHRVLPLASGVRYTAVIFFKLEVRGLL